VVSTDGKEHYRLGSWLPVSHISYNPPYPELMVGEVRVKSAWDNKGSAFYALVWRDNRRFQIFRWRPGSDVALIPVGQEFPAVDASLTAQPNSDEMLIRPSRKSRWAQDSTFLIDAAGRVTPVPTARPTTSLKFARENQFVCFDDAGRLITIAGPPSHEALMSTDPTTGESKRLYP
jgi:hypothetical protein